KKRSLSASRTKSSQWANASMRARYRVEAASRNGAWRNARERSDRDQAGGDAAVFPDENVVGAHRRPGRHHFEADPVITKAPAKDFGQRPQVRPRSEHEQLDRVRLGKHGRQ